MLLAPVAIGNTRGEESDFRHLDPMTVGTATGRRGGAGWTLVLNGVVAMSLSLLEGLPYQINLWVHIVAGSWALATFWTAATARKGGRLHRNAGRIFMLAMCAVLASGVLLVLRSFAHGALVSGVFLGYLFFITGQACWMAWRAVQDKADWRVMVARPAWRLWMLSCLMMGVGAFVIGLRVGNPVVIGFSLIGPVLGVRMWRFARRGPERSNWHIAQHYKGILGAGAATHVSFLSIGMSHVWPQVAKVWPALPPGLLYTFPWYAPATAAGIALLVLNRRYGHKGRALPNVQGNAIASTLVSKVHRNRAAKTS